MQRDVDDLITVLVDGLQNALQPIANNVTAIKLRKIIMGVCSLVWKNEEKPTQMENGIEWNMKNRACLGRRERKYLTSYLSLL